MIKPRTASYVRAVAEEGSFSRAAEKLYISQLSLSANIIRAEKEYDVQFFNRSTTPVTLTYAGEIFLKAAGRIEQTDEQGKFYTIHEVSLLMSEIVAEHLKGRSEIKIYDKP